MMKCARLCNHNVGIEIEDACSQNYYIIKIVLSRVFVYVMPIDRNLLLI